MTQNEKELLLKDLCCRLPYGVVVQLDYLVHDEMFLPDAEYDRIINIDVDTETIITNGWSKYHIDEVRPYLFPMSSMTDEQIDELKDLCDMYDPVNDNDDYEDWGTCLMTKHFMDDVHRFKFNFRLFDFLNKNRLDYRGLIPMGLAIDATGLGIY